jgi:hypothetical protein
MKSMIIAICLMASIFTQSAKATEPVVTHAAVQAFEITFRGAEGATWSQVNGLFKVSFKMDERQMFAFFNDKGELVVVAKYLKVAQLPKSAQSKLAEVTKGYSITELFEINDGEKNKYYAALSNGTTQKVVESTGGRWSAFKNSSK